MHPQPEIAAQAQRAALVEAFNHVLGNTCCLQNAALFCEWNVRGPYALAASKLFHRQADEMFRALNPIANCIQVTGHSVRLDLSDRIIPGHTQADGLSDPRARALLDLLSLGHKNAVISIEAAADIALEFGNRRSLRVLAARRAAHEEHLVHLETIRR